MMGRLRVIILSALLALLLAVLVLFLAYCGAF